MTIGAATPAISGTGEKIAGAAGEPGGAADMFGEIIAGMAAATGTDAAEQYGAEAAEGEVPPVAAEPAIAASVAQLLALTVRQQGKARVAADDEQASEEPQGSCELPLISLGDDVPEIATLPQPGLPIAQPGLPVAKANEPVATPTPAAPQVLAAQGDAGQKVAELAKALIDQPEAEKAAPRTVAAAQIADLLKAVTKPITLANTRSAAPDQGGAKEDAPKIAAPEPRAFLQAALAATVPASFAPPEMLQPLDAVADAGAASAKTDFSEFAIERQLDVSAEGEWLDSLAKDIARSAAEGGTLRFKLNPENLGSLRVEITPHANGSAVRLTAETDTARAIIADAQPRLVAEARANGVRIAETHVDLGGQNPSGDPRRQQAAFDEAPIRTARFLRDEEPSDGKPTRSQSERYA